MAKRYCRITFLPAGGKRRRTTWAIETTSAKAAAGGSRTFEACDKEGEVWKDIDAKTERKEIILCSAHEVDVRPAQMNLKYGWLELVCPQCLEPYPRSDPKQDGKALCSPCASAEWLRHAPANEVVVMGLATKPPCLAETIKAMQAAGLTHVVIGDATKRADGENDSEK